MGRVGLVLGAGGIVGQAYHAGTMAAIAEATGWDPRGAEIIVGTSAGSSYGALLRAGIAPRDLAARALGEQMSDQAKRRLAHAPGPAAIPEAPPVRGIPRPASPRLLARAARVPWSARLGTLAAGVLPEGRVPTEVIGAALRPLFGDAWPSLAFWACAVRLDDGQRVAFGQEGAPKVDVATAVEASCAIPGFFAPVVIGGVRYVDGGAHSPTNLDLVADLSLDLVIVSSPMSAARSVALPGGLRVVRSYQLGREARTVRRTGADVLAFQPTASDLDVMGWNPMDASRRGDVLRRARESALRHLERDGLRDRVSLLER